MLLYLSMIESDGDRSKFEIIYEEYSGLMYRLAMQILHQQEDAEDAVHQAFVSIIENLSNISDPKSPKTRAFAVIITERKAIDIVRGRAKISQAEFDETAFGVAVPLTGEDNGLADAILSLPAIYREIILLRYHYGFSTREIARILDMTDSAAQKTLWRAKKRLERILNGGDVCGES